MAGPPPWDFGGLARGEPWQFGRTDRDTLRQWVVYDRPLDHPDKVVARAWLIVRGQSEPVPVPEAVLFDTIEDARRWLSRDSNLICLPRDPRDHPTVVEVWT